MGSPTRLSRRSLLSGAGACCLGLAAGCTDSAASEPRAPNTTPTAGATTAPAPATATVAPDASSQRDIALVQAAIADERAILAYCATAAAGHFPGSAALRVIADQQRQHVRTLRGTLTDAGPDHVGRVPHRLHGDAALGTARKLLEQAQGERRSDALAAQSGLLARLLASMSASHAVAANLASLRP